MSQITLLETLQTIDSEIQEKKARLTEVLALLQESAELQAARAADAQAATALRQAQGQQHNLELELQGLIEKRTRSRERLYSGTVKNSRELLDLQQEVESLARRQVVLEDNVLAAMLAAEEAQEQKEVSAGHLVQVTAAHERQHELLSAERQQLVARLTALLAQRKQHTPRLEARLLTEYEEIRRKRRGLAVVALDQFNICGGCRMTVSGAVVKAAQEGEYVLCGNCGRIATAPPRVA
jgi:predicted  nucleic acid-binding Zn-ribbon protein